MKILDISIFEMVKYSVRSVIGCIIVFWDEAYYVPGLLNYLLMISPHGICTSEGCKGNFIDTFYDEHDSYAELNLKKDKPGWKKAKPMLGFT